MNRKLCNLVGLFVTCGVLLSLASCSKQGNVAKGGHVSASQTGVKDILQSGLADQSSTIPQDNSDPSGPDFASLPAYTSQSVPPTEETVPSFSKNEEGIEVDLTELSSGAVYSVVYDIRRL